MYPHSAHRFLFYAKELDAHSKWVELIGEEHHHLSHVLRMPAGSTAFVTNGQGLIARCRLDAIERGSARLEVEDIEGGLSHTRPVTVALGCLRKEGFEQAVKQCTELGMTRCIPFSSNRAHVKDFSPAFLDRLRRIALSAMKQSFRSMLPDILPVCRFGELVDRAKEATGVVVGDAEGEPPGAVPGNAPTMIVVGPEGGLDSVERSELGALGAVFVSVSPHRLRSETAAAALLTLALARSEGHSGRD